MLIAEKLLRKWLNNLTTLVSNLKLRYFSRQKNFHYYKIQNGGKIPMLVNNIVIVFIMEIMNK
jgi:hypothetical protein